MQETRMRMMIERIERMMRVPVQRTMMKQRLMNTPCQSLAEVVLFVVGLVLLSVEGIVCTLSYA